MQLNSLTAISPVDGRYFSVTNVLAAYFSEYALQRYRIRIEVEYIAALVEYSLPELAAFPKNKTGALRSLYTNFNETESAKIKEIEATTNHDVKAIEYYLRNKFDDFGLSDFKEFIHFGLTSQDINNTATPLLIKEFLEKEFLPCVNDLVAALKAQSKIWAAIPMLARTHGQPATPTRLGKEILVFAERISKQLDLLKTIPHTAKFGGASGNFNAHHIAYPAIDWNDFGNRFAGSFGLVRSNPTTQIEHYDNLAALFDNLKRINTILIDYSRDMWQYISMSYFKQRIKAGEIGSSAMPHKVNPIDFENAEGNLGIANALFEHFSAKLPVSRLQRDLTDSTVLRNTGVPMAHSWIALRSLEKGIAKLELNQDAIANDLQENWVVVAEAIQTILRKEGYPDPYEALKQLTRVNSKVTKETLAAFIDGLDVADGLKRRLKEISPFSYTGI